MEINELTHDERLLLVGLLEMVVNADQVLSEEEDRALKRIAAQVGAEAFQAAIQEADARFTGPEDIRQLALAIQRPEARELIFTAIQEVAVSDEVTIEEMQLVNWLADLWDL
jgi:hypothetical protein